MALYSGTGGLVSTEGGGGSSGLSSSQVVSLIENNSEYTFINSTPIQGSSLIDITEGVDTSKYHTFKFQINGLTPASSIFVWFGLIQGDQSTLYSNITYSTFKYYSGTSFSYSGGSSNVYFDSSSYFSSAYPITGSVIVTYDPSYNYVSGFYEVAMNPNTGRGFYGSFNDNTRNQGFGGIRFGGGTYNTAGSIDLYGIKAKA